MLICPSWRRYRDLDFAEMSRGEAEGSVDSPRCVAAKRLYDTDKLSGGAEGTGVASSDALSMQLSDHSTVWPEHVRDPHGRGECGDDCSCGG